jgi:hypothetical protein
LFNVDDHGQFFSVAINYGGCSVGSGINMSYRGGVHDSFNFCDSDKWNIKALEIIMKEIGIVMTEVPRLLWCLRGQSVHNLGLADIMNDEDCYNMVGAVAVGHNVLSIYVDHDDSMREYYNDADICHNVCYISYFKNFLCTYLSAIGLYLKFL